MFRKNITGSDRKYAVNGSCHRSAEPLRTRVVHVGHVPICAIRLPELLRAFDDVLQQRTPSYACFCGAHLCVCAARDRRVRRVLQEADFCLPDGVAATLGARLLGERLPERMPGPSVMLDICEYGLSRGYRHFFYGGAEGVPGRLAQKLQERFPGLQVAGAYSPPFRELTTEEDEEVVSMINRSNPDIVWAGLGAPKQEMWARDHLGRLSSPLILAVGAAFDFNSGNKRRAPVWMRRMGLEWFFRMCTEGRQMFLRYAQIVPLFMMMILKQALLRRVGMEKNHGKQAEEEPVSLR